MATNRYTCCICHAPRQPVEKHHINGDPSDNAWNNLVVVCRNCHGLVTAKSNLGTRYTPGEVLQYKLDWEKRCGEADTEEIESPVDEVHETKTIEANEHEIYLFEMEEGDELVFSIDADGPLDVVVCDEEDAEAWAEDIVDEEEEDEEFPLPAGYVHREGVTYCGDRSFAVPEDGRYILLLVNWEDEPVDVTVDAAVWPDGE